MPEKDIKKLLIKRVDKLKILLSKPQQKLLGLVKDKG